MKAFYFCCLLFFYAETFAEWRQITKDEEKIYFVESDFIVPHLDDRRMAKELHEFRNISKDGITSLRIRSEFNCKMKETRILAMDKIAGEMGVGKIISLQDKPTKWESVPSNSSRNKVLNFVCNK
tara:strand:+ start:607 stop:981 length:375 start_codon:yes stop_codon:yes gene_type:complete